MTVFSHLYIERLKSTPEKVNKMKKRKLFKALIISLALVLTAWCGMFATDYYRSGHLMTPMFAKCINDGGNPTYKGLGYTVVAETQGDSDCCGTSIISVTMYVGEKAVSASII